MPFFSAIRKFAGKLHEGLLVILKPMQIVGNFVFLGIAYFVGVGFSALLYRMGPGRKKSHGKTGQVSKVPDIAAGVDSASLWIKLPPAPSDKDAWLRPF